MENYVGKIIKITRNDPRGNAVAVTGIVYEQGPGSYPGYDADISLIKTTGELSKISVKSASTPITYTKIDPELRAALKEAYKAKTKLIAFEEKYREEKSILDKSLSLSLSAVKENSPDMTSTEFADAVEKMFTDRYPDTGGSYDRKYFHCSSWSRSEITVSQTQDVEKWASPEKFGFLYREYDNTIHIRYDSKEFKDFCARNAPRIIPELEKHCKTGVSGSLGDKDWLSVERTYTFPIKYGYSKKSLDDIGERFFGIAPKKASLTSQINDAETLKNNSIAEKSKQQKREELIRK